MRAQLTGNKYKRGLTHRSTAEGISTLEIMIAFAIIMLCVTAVTLVTFGNQSVAVDSETNNEAIAKAQKILEDARANSRKDFTSVDTDTFPPESIYNLSQDVTDLTQCKKEVASEVSWTVGSRTLSVNFSTFLSDIQGALDVGGDCATEPPGKKWDNPQRFASDTYNPGKPTSIDVLNKIAYLGADKTPFFYIADTRSTVLGQNGGIFVTFSNGFKLLNQPNALDVVNYPALDETYAFAAMDTITNQLQVIKVTNINAPELVKSVPLKNTGGSFPQGWRLKYFKNRLYVINRETAGPEFHIFDVSDPLNPTELGNGTSLNITVEDIVIQEKKIGGVTKRIAYLATDQDSGELKVYDITDPSNNGTISEIVAARQNLAGNNDGVAVFTIGNKLYFGRQSSSGADLYVFNSTNPTTGMSILGSKDIGTSVIDVVVAGKFAFIATSKTNQEFQVWDISKPLIINNIAIYNFGNIVEQGVEYEPDFIYTTGQSTPNFQILYSPT